VAYNGAAALLHGSSAMASVISTSAHCPAWNGLQPYNQPEIWRLVTAAGCEHHLWAIA